MKHRKGHGWEPEAQGGPTKTEFNVTGLYYLFKASSMTSSVPTK